MLHQRLDRIASCGPPPHRVASTPSVAAGTRAAPTPGAAARERTSCCLRRRDGKKCRLYTHNGTKALLRHLHKARRHIILYARGELLEIHRTNVALFGGSRPRNTGICRSCRSSTPHLTGHGPGRPVKTRGLPHGHGGRHSSSSIVRRISWAAVRAGLSKHMVRLKGRAERPI